MERYELPPVTAAKIENSKTSDLLISWSFQ
jgi:hypothetical protein